MRSEYIFASMALLPLLIGCRDTITDPPPASPPEEIEVGIAPTAIAAVAGKIAVGEVAFDFGGLTFGPGVVRWIDPSTGAVLGATEVGTNPQVVIAAGAARDRLVAVCTGDYGAIGGELDLLDPDAMAIERTIPLDGQPSAACAGPGDLVYLGSYGDGGVAVVDPIAGQIIRDWDPGAGYEAAAVAARGENLFAVDFDSDLLIHLDSDGVVLDAIAVGDGPIDLVADPRDPDRVYVLHSLEETLGVVSLGGRSFSRFSEPIGRAPNDVQWHDGALWIVASLSNEIQSLDPAGGELLLARHVGVNRNPMQLAFAGGWVFVTNLLSNTVSVLSAG